MYLFNFTFLSPPAPKKLEITGAITAAEPIIAKSKLRAIYFL